ncbi:unnamed protein product [Schistocephalus solidus]|uniref:30S ribosomal protein S19 n=1 Tax=Schistocephalus solidus TaxID=70667 RepID=A0A183TKW7_SCHSO|nr:unnamed protein product [Schistocephalus solidus]
MPSISSRIPCKRAPSREISCKKIDRLLIHVESQPPPATMFDTSGRYHSLQHIITRFGFEATEPGVLSSHRGERIEVLGREDKN